MGNLVKTGHSITQQQQNILNYKSNLFWFLLGSRKIYLVTLLKTSLRSLRMKSPNFHTEISILTFLLLWSISSLPFCCYGEELQDVQVKIIKEAKKCTSETTAEPGDHLEVHYEGRLDDENGKKFDASRDRGNLFKFQLGAGQVIQGYEKGVPGMCKGEIRTLTVPPHLGYGERGVGGVIPGGATLHFTVELVKITKGTLNKNKEL